MMLMMRTTKKCTKTEAHRDVARHATHVRQTAKPLRHSWLDALKRSLRASYAWHVTSGTPPPAAFDAFATHANAASESPPAQLPASPQLSSAWIAGITSRSRAPRSGAAPPPLVALRL